MTRLFYSLLFFFFPFLLFCLYSKTRFNAFLNQSYCDFGKSTLGKSDFALSATERYLKEEKEFLDLDSISGVQSWRNEVEAQVQATKLIKQLK